MSLILDGDFAEKIAADAFAAGWRACVSSMQEMLALHPRLSVAQLLDIASDIPTAARLPAVREAGCADAVPTSADGENK